MSVILKKEKEKGRKESFKIAAFEDCRTFLRLPFRSALRQRQSKNVNQTVAATVSLKWCGSSAVGTDRLFFWEKQHEGLQIQKGDKMKHIEPSAGKNSSRNQTLK